MLWEKKERCVDRQTFSKSFPVREKKRYEKRNKLQKRTIPWENPEGTKNKICSAGKKKYEEKRGFLKNFAVRKKLSCEKGNKLT
jgi:hypothetical protein